MRRLWIYCSFTGWWLILLLSFAFNNTHVMCVCMCVCQASALNALYIQQLHRYNQTVSQGLTEHLHTTSDTFINSRGRLINSCPCGQRHVTTTTMENTYS